LVSKGPREKVHSQRNAIHFRIQGNYERQVNAGGTTRQPFSEIDEQEKDSEKADVQNNEPQLLSFNPNPFPLRK
jgi:hypothetical protein